MRADYGLGLAREARYRWRCRQCFRQFSVRTGTPLERTGIPMAAWLRAMLALDARHGSVSSTEISRMTGSAYKSAVWLRARLALALPVFGFHERGLPSHWTGNWSNRRWPLCPGCGEALVNTRDQSRCPRCRASSKFKEAQASYAAECGEWRNPSKESTWWKIGRARMVAANRLCGSALSRRSVEKSEPAETSPA